MLRLPDLMLSKAVWMEWTFSLGPTTIVEGAALGGSDLQ
jgi:hypothetical protein